MALRLNDLVVRGELINVRNYSTHGWLQLRGHEQPLLLQLTGNCDPDLKGKHIRFEAPNAEALENVPCEPGELADLAWQQVGPTGTMTAERKVKVDDGSPEESSASGERNRSPLRLKRCLFLEWFSQNGRVVLELIDPIIEFVDSESEEPADKARDPDELADGPSERGGVSTELPGTGPSEELTAGDFEPQGDALEAFGEDDEEAEDDIDPYGLFPDDLKEQFEREASALDRVIASDDETSETIREIELMDELIEHGEGDVIASIFEQPLRLPRPEHLGDDEVETMLKTLLAQLALFGIALDVCEHYSPRDAYRLLLERICCEERTYPELRQTQWVHHFMTSEFCDECDAEMQREFEEYERREGKSAETPEDDELPF